MPRPSVDHKGFLVPNAAGLLSPQMAEPDQVDFNTLGNARYGVIDDGCLVTVTGSSASCEAGTVLIDGMLVNVPSASGVSIATSISLDRYDLLVVDTSGKLQVQPGTPAQDPVFPKPSANVTMLAAVYCKAGESNFSETVIDKRNMLARALLTKVPPTSPLVANRNGTGDMFRVNGDGGTVWGNDTIIQRVAPKTLQVTENINLDGNLTAGDTVQARTVTATGKVAGSNLQTGPSSPTGPGADGDIYQSQEGRLFIRRAGAWEEVATLASTIPPGTVINSMQAPSAMAGLGWLPLNGTTVVHEDVYPALFSIPEMAPFIATGATSPHRTMTLPDATGRMLLCDFVTPAQHGGATNFSITESNMPRHKHDVSTTLSGGSSTSSVITSPAGGHGHTTTDGHGQHGHAVNDRGHAHQGMWDPLSQVNAKVVALQWGGQNKIDALFSDRSHTYSVEAMEWSAPAYTGVEIQQSGSQHRHGVDPVGDHSHTINVSGSSNHTHGVNEAEKGLGTPISFTPPYLTVFCYIKA